MSASSKKQDLTARPSVSNITKGLAVTLWVAVAFFVGAVAMQSVFSILNLIGLSLDGLSDSVQTMVKAATMYVSAMLIAVGVPSLIKRKIPDTATLGLHRLLDWWDVLLGPISYVPYFILTCIFILIATALFPGFDVDQAQEIGFQTMTSQTGYVMAFLTLVVVAPFAEEVLFRGYLYGKLRQYIGLVGAILLTSLCFAALHMQLNVAVDVFALSIVLCLLREFTGSIWAGVLLHMTKNFIAFCLLFIVPML